MGAMRHDVRPHIAQGLGYRWDVACDMRRDMEAEALASVSLTDCRRIVRLRFSLG